MLSGGVVITFLHTLSMSHITINELQLIEVDCTDTTFPSYFLFLLNCSLCQNLSSGIYIVRALSLMLTAYVAPKSVTLGPD